MAEVFALERHIIPIEPGEKTHQQTKFFCSDNDGDHGNDDDYLWCCTGAGFLPAAGVPTVSVDGQEPGRETGILPKAGCGCELFAILSSISSSFFVILLFTFYLPL